MSRKSSSERRRKVSAITRPSDLVSGAASEGAGSAPRSEPAQPADGAIVDVVDDVASTANRELPPVMELALEGGETVELQADQVFADRVVIRRGEKGQALYPSSQAAAWVVHFPRVGKKLRVIPENLLLPV